MTYEIYQYLLTGLFNIIIVLPLLSMSLVIIILELGTILRMTTKYVHRVFTINYHVLSPLHDGSTILKTFVWAYRYVFIDKESHIIITNMTF